MRQNVDEISLVSRIIKRFIVTIVVMYIQTEFVSPDSDIPTMSSHEEWAVFLLHVLSRRRIRLC